VNGQLLDGSKGKYTLTFASGQFPPVNAFWSVTMYYGKTELLIDNPINRYLINSPMLPNIKKNKDGSLTLCIQKDAPEADKKSNWLPAPETYCSDAALLAEDRVAFDSAPGRRNLEAASDERGPIAGKSSPLLW
jgi:hypothetical protein